MAMTIPRVAPLRDRALAVMKPWAERVRRTSRITRARVGYAWGLATSAWGAGVLWGFGWALLFGGVAASVSFLTLYPVDDR